MYNALAEKKIQELTSLNGSHDEFLEMLTQAFEIINNGFNGHELDSADADIDRISSKLRCYERVLKAYQTIPSVIIEIPEDITDIACISDTLNISEPSIQNLYEVIRSLNKKYELLEESKKEADEKIGELEKTIDMTDVTLRKQLKNI